MNSATDPIESILAAAVEIPSVAERRRYVEQACAGDVELKRRVEAMVEYHFRAGSFLESQAPDLGATADQSAGERPGTMVGPYKLLEQIGEGGFGVVFMAEQTTPVRRKVALKILKPGMDTRQVVARFEAERQALAITDHPNIAKVFDGGATPTGRPYFVMELVKGVPITEFCDQHHLTPRQRLELFVQVCQAVQHAHQKGIIHRDLKPSNILVVVHDTTPVPKVIDFGIAKALGQELTDKTLFTGFAQLVGTPLYMSPEQAGQSGLDVDTRSDIYALGVLLYELLTATTPFDKDRFKQAAYDEICRIIREEEPPRPSTRLAQSTETLPSISARRHMEPAKLTRLVRGELDWIVMKAIEKDRTRRYETAAALATDVQRYLADEPVLACPPSAWYRFGKFTRRNRREVLAAGVAAIAGVTGVTGLGVSRALIAGALKTSTKAKEQLATALEEARVEAYFHRITLAHHALSADNLTAALHALEECPESLRGWEWHYLMRLLKVGPLMIRDRTEVLGVAFGPDGASIAAAGGDGVVRIWNSRTGGLIQAFQAHNKSVCCVAFHPHGRYLASAGADRLAKVWDLSATDRAVWAEPCDAIRKFGAAYTVAFRPPDGRHLAAGCDEEVVVRDWEDHQSLRTFPGPEYHSIPVAFSRDGRRLATVGAWQKGLCLWDAETGQSLGTLPAPPHPISALAFSADGRRLASASFGRTVSLWDPTTRELFKTLHHTGNVLGVDFTPDGRRLASAGEDKTVHLWDPATGREVLGLHGHTDMCGSVAFSPDGWRLASGSHDGTIRVWDATPLRGDEGQGMLTFTRHDHEIRSLAVSPDGKRIVSAGNGTPVTVWDAATGRVTFNFDGHSVLVFSVAWHPDGRRIATAGSVGRQHSVKVWDPSDGQVQFRIPVGRHSSAGPYQVVAFSPDSRYLVTGQLEGAVQVWDAETGREVHMLGTHKREVRGVAFSRDGKHLATASGDGEVKLWDAKRLGEKQDPRILPIRARVPGPSVNVAFSPDGRRLATGGDGYTVQVWDVEKNGELLTTLRGHTKDVYAVAFSPDDEGRWVASGGEDSKVKIWDGRSGELVHTFHGHTGLVSSLAFSPDGKWLCSGSRDTTVKVWDLTPLSQVPEC